MEVCCKVLSFHKILKLAKALYECCYSCLNRAQMELNQENLDGADRWVQEYQRCKRDLDKLIERKRQFDNMKGIVRVFSENNMDLEKVLEKIDHCCNSSHKHN